MLGEGRALHEGRKKGKASGNTKPWAVSTGTGWIVGTRSLGTVGTVLGGITTYASEREKQEQEIWRQNPGMSRDTVEKEAAYDAGAQTVGQVGSTVLASAAAGAAAGTVVPGIGNVAGLAAGVAAGVAMSVPLLDSDGDGQKDSLAEAAGDGVEWLADKVPADLKRGAVEVADTVAEGVGDAVGGFVNWVKGDG